MARVRRPGSPVGKRRRSGEVIFDQIGISKPILRPSQCRIQPKEEVQAGSRACRELERAAMSQTPGKIEPEVPDNVTPADACFARTDALVWEPEKI